MILVNVMGITPKNQIFSLIYKVNPGPNAISRGLSLFYCDFPSFIRVIAAFEIFSPGDPMIQFLEQHYQDELITG